MSCKSGHLALTVFLLSMAHLPAAVAQQTFPTWVDRYFQNRAMQLESTDQYVKVIDSPGPDLGLPADAAGVCARKTCQGFDVSHGTRADGTKTVAERPKPPAEMGVEAGITSSKVLEAMGKGLLDAQLQINGTLGGPTSLGGMEQLLQYGGSPVALMTNPTTMFALGGKMMLDASLAVAEAEQTSANSDQLAQAEAGQQIEIYRNASYAGSDQVGNSPASLYKGTIPPNLAATLSAQQSQQMGPNAAQFVPGSVSLWVDDTKQRFLKQRLDGKAVANGQTRDFYIEVEYSDFRNPPGCGQMDEPFQRTMRMGGILDDEQMAQMEEARAKLAEFDKQLAAMPAQQRQMMERMMGSQMQQMRNMMNSGAFEYVEQTEQIICNPDLASLYSVGPAPAAGQDNLVQRIQEYLVILGFEPGNINGVMDVMTQIAISEFQAMQGLPVNGEPSEELAMLLAMLVEGR